MKKTLLICALSLATAVGSFAQSTVTFANDASSMIRLPGGSTAAGVPAGSTYQVELMYAPSGTEDALFDTVAIRLGAAANFAPTPGRFNSGARTAPTATPGSEGRYQVRAWETAYGTSYQDVFTRNAGGNVGRSPILNIVGGNPLTTPAGTPGTLTGGGFTGFNVAPVPEPSTIALGLAGVGALLLLRRRK